MIGNGSMIVFVLCSIGCVLTILFLLIKGQLIEHRERMLDEELNYREEEEERCKNCGLKLVDCDCEDPTF